MRGAALQAAQLGFRFIVQIHPKIDHREGLVTIDHQGRRVLPFGLPPGIPSGLHGAHQSFCQRLIGSIFKGFGHGLDHTLTRQHIACNGKAISHDVPGPGRIFLAREGVGTAIHIHHSHLPGLRIRVRGQQLVNDFFS